MFLTSCDKQSYYLQKLFHPNLSLAFTQLSSSHSHSASTAPPAVSIPGQRLNSSSWSALADSNTSCSLRPPVFATMRIQSSTLFPIPFIITKISVPNPRISKRKKTQIPIPTPSISSCSSRMNSSTLFMDHTSPATLPAENAYK